MTYTELLNKIIQESNLKNKEIVEKCTEAGTPITSNYISILKNDPTKIPSDKVSYTLAKVCRAEYENILVVQAYIDKAPEPIKKFMEIVKETEIQDMKDLIKQKNPQINQKDIEELKVMELAEFICSYIKEWENDPTSSKKELEKYISKMIQQEQEKSKDWALIKINHDTPIKYLTDDELKKIT